MLSGTLPIAPFRTPLNPTLRPLPPAPGTRTSLSLAKKPQTAPLFIGSIYYTRTAGGQASQKEVNDNVFLKQLDSYRE